MKAIIPSNKLLPEFSFVTVEKCLVDIIKQTKEEVKIELDNILIDIKNEIVLVKLKLTYQGEQEGTEKPLVTEGVPIIRLKLAEMNNISIDRLKDFSEIVLDNALDNLVENNVLGISSTDGYIKS